MASTTRSVLVPYDLQSAYQLAQEASEPIRDFKLQRAYPAKRVVLLARGFGLTNPIDIKLQVQAVSDDESEIEITSSMMAVWDPFGFNDTTLDRFEHQIQQFVKQRQDGTVPDAPLKDTKGLKVTLWILGVAAVFLVPLFACLFADILF